MGDQASIKKVAPYPISVDVSKVSQNGGPGTAGQVLKENIVKLTDLGFLMRVEAQHVYKVGEDCALQFQLPVLNMRVQAQGKVVKLYSTKKENIVEIHFRSLPDRERKGIFMFVQKIGQTEHG